MDCLCAVICASHNAQVEQLSITRKENNMSQPIVFISHFKVKEGKLDDFKQHAQMVREHIKANKPGTVAFLQYLNMAETELSIIHIFPDAEAYDRHLEG